MSNKKPTPANDLRDDRPGPGWNNICYRCLGSLIEWPGMGRCRCEAPRRIEKPFALTCSPEDAPDAALDGADA